VKGDRSPIGELTNMVRDIFDKHGIKISMRNARLHAMDLYARGCQVQVECEDVSRWRGVFECSECHWTDEDIGTADQIRFCAGCGAKLKGGA
jgi:hypothetical protein